MLYSEEPIATHVQLYDALLELETYMTWAAVDTEWVARREKWMTEVQAAASSPAGLAALLAEFESKIYWKMMRKPWNKRRSTWRPETRRVNSRADFARLLLELEENLHGAAFDQGWAQRRESWTRELTQAAGA